MSKLPFMHVRVGDFVADTSHLSPEEVGVYWRLIMHLWQRGGTVPNDVKILCRVAGLSPRRWHIVAPNVLPFFHETVQESGSVLTHARVERELFIANQISDKRKHSGKLGGDANSLKLKDPEVANAIANAIASAQANGKQTPQQTDSTPRARARSTTITTNKKDPPPQAREREIELIDLEDQEAGDPEIALEAYNTVAGRVQWPPATMTEPRYRALTSAVQSTGGLAGWQAMLEKAAAATFLTDGSFSIGIDFFTTPQNMLKITEGNYDDRTRKQHRPSPARSRSSGIDGMLDAIDQASLGVDGRDGRAAGNQRGTDACGPTLDLTASPAVAGRVR